MFNCSNCGSQDFSYGGVLMQGRKKMVKMVCKNCGTNQFIGKEAYDEIDADNMLDYDDCEGIEGNKIVITCAVMGYQTNLKFLTSLEAYCFHNDASLYVIPIKYKNSESPQEANEELDSYYINSNFDFGNNFKIMGALKLNASMEHPLSGLEPLSKGKSIIFGHPQVALKTVPTDQSYPAILSTTGCVTEKLYTDTKQGLKANFNHSNSAVVLENDIEGNTHIRHLNFDGEGFYDLTNYYASNEVTEHDQMETSALITGDEHVMFQDDSVVKATYTNSDSIVNTLMPEQIIRHDVLDAYTVSHHHKHNVFTKFAKYKEGAASIKEELDTTIKFIVETTPYASISVIVSSNHNDHLLRWLNECDPEIEPWNAEIYHWFMWKMLGHTTMGESGAEYPNPFELYVKEFYPNESSTILFIGRNEPYMVQDVSVNCHGDVGTNGSRGSRRQFSSLPTKHVIGHSHSPGIEKGAYQTGTSSRMKLEYNKGPSSWDHCHCVIYPNGKRQLIFIRNGKWRA